MIPILYNRLETEFRSNGLGRLAECISCRVEEERNGKYELTLEYPITGKHYAELTEGALICARHSDALDVQPFRIYKITRPLAGVVTVYARHLSYDLNKLVVLPFTEPSLTQLFLNLPSHSVTACPFTFETDKTVNTPFSVTVPATMRSLLGGSEGSILDVYGGEYEFDGYKVRLTNNRGTDAGVTIRYGKNLTELTQEGDASGNVTAVLPFWSGSNEDGEETTVYAQTPIYSGVGYLEAYEDSRAEQYTNGTNVYEGTITPVMVEPLDMSDEFETAPTVEQLTEAAETWLDAHASVTPAENIKVSFVQLWQTNEYKDFAPLQRVGLCDTVTVEYARLGVKATTKVIKTVYNVLLERFDSMELGEPKSTLAETIVNAEKVADGIGAEINKKVDAAKSAMQIAIENATDLLSGGLGGHLIINRNADGKPNELLIMDTDSIATAENVIRINLNGIGFSQNGYNGPFETAWTIDGRFNASYIVAGILSAILIQGPTAETFWDLSTGFFQNHGTSSVTAQVETSEGTYTPTTYNVDHNTRIAGGLLTIEGKHDSGAYENYLKLGIAAEGMNYEFLRDLPTAHATSYPYAGMDLRGDRMTGEIGLGTNSESRQSVLYNAHGTFAPDYIVLGETENITDLQGGTPHPGYTQDRNILRLTGGWCKPWDALTFEQHYHPQGDGSVRYLFDPAIYRPQWCYTLEDDVAYHEFYTVANLGNNRTELRFSVPLQRTIGDPKVLGCYISADLLSVWQGTNKLQTRVDLSNLDIKWMYNPDPFNHQDYNDSASLQITLKRNSGNWGGTNDRMCMVWFDTLWFYFVDYDNHLGE